MKSKDPLERIGLSYLDRSLFDEIRRVTDLTADWDRMGLVRSAIASRKALEDLAAPSMSATALAALSGAGSLEEQFRQARSSVLGFTAEGVLREHARLTGSSAIEFEKGASGALAALKSFKGLSGMAGLGLLNQPSPFTAENASRELLAQYVRTFELFPESGLAAGLRNHLEQAQQILGQIDDSWGVPAWRPNFEASANASLGRLLIGRGTTRSKRRDATEESFASIRTTQGQADRDRLTELVAKHFPKLLGALKGARDAVEHQGPDYRTHFAGSARKLIDRFLDKLAPHAELRKWSKDSRDFLKKEPTQATFRARIRYVFRGSPQAWAVFMESDVLSVEALRSHFCKMDHESTEEPHAFILALQLRVEGLLLLMLNEHERFPDS